MKTKTTLTALTLAAVLGVAMYTALPAGAQDDGMGIEQGMGMGMRMGGPGDGAPMPPFETLDADKDGKVTAAEVTAFRKAAIIGSDSNADGKLSAEELTAQQVRILTDRAAERSARMILIMDLDGDGLLSVEELAAGPGPMRMFDRMDADGDGEITKAEADAAMQKMQGRQGGPGRDGKGDGRKGGRHHDGPENGGPTPPDAPPEGDTGSN